VGACRGQETRATTRGRAPQLGFIKGAKGDCRLKRRALAACSQRPSFNVDLTSLGVAQPLSVPVDALAVREYLTPLPQVAYHVPVEGAFIAASGFGVAGAESQVERAA